MIYATVRRRRKIDRALLRDDRTHDRLSAIESAQYCADIMKSTQYCADEISIRDIALTKCTCPCNIIVRVHDGGNEIREFLRPKLVSGSSVKYPAMGASPVYCRLYRGRGTHQSSPSLQPMLFSSHFPPPHPHISLLYRDRIHLTQLPLVYIRIRTNTTVLTQTLTYF